jgi:sulfur carrier protein ThiS
MPPAREKSFVLWTAVISAIVAIIVAILQFGPGWTKGDSAHDTAQKPVVVAGRVVDLDSNTPVAGADISVGGNPSGYITENNGNFRFEFVDKSSDQRVRVRIDKPGYISWDRSVAVPSNDLMVQLQKKKR